TTISNDYSNIGVLPAGPYDRYCPGCTAIYVAADAISSAGGVQGAVAGSLTQNSATNGLFYNHQYINFTNAGEWYYVRVNGVTAPSVAGRYFFKIWLGDITVPYESYLGGEE